MQRGRDAADVPAVAGGEQRQQADRRVLGRVRRPGHVARVDPGRCELVRRAASTTPPWSCRCRGGQVERLLAEHLAGGDAPLQVATRPATTPRPTPKQSVAAPHGSLDVGAEDPDVGDDRARSSSSPASASVDHRDAFLEVEGRDQVGLPHVHVDGPSMDRRVRGRRVDRADEPAGRRPRRPAPGSRRWSGCRRGRPRGRDGSRTSPRLRRRR